MPWLISMVNNKLDPVAVLYEMIMLCTGSGQVLPMHYQPYATPFDTQLTGMTMEVFEKYRYRYRYR